MTSRYDHATYPEFPGFAPGSVTSIDAAEEIDAAGLQLAVTEMLRYGGPMTPDELASRMRRDKLSVRPRCTELKAKGLIHETGEMRRNASGHRAAVLAISEKE
jgi:hypothetical protein